MLPEKLILLRELAVISFAIEKVGKSYLAGNRREV